MTWNPELSLLLVGAFRFAREFVDEPHSTVECLREQTRTILDTDRKRMGRFLFAVWPYAGQVNPRMSLAERLRERGHSIGFYTGASVAQTDC